MILCKSSVRFRILRRQLWTVFPIVEEIWERHATTPVITCGSDAHGMDDPHYHGFACDIRSKNLPSDEAKHDVLYKIREALGDDYTVILESEGTDNEHFHIQIKKGLWRTFLNEL